MKYKNGEPPEYWLKKAKEASLDVAVLYLTHAVEALLEERAAEQSVQADGACSCPDDGNLQINSNFVCAVCGKTPRR